MSIFVLSCSVPPAISVCLFVCFVLCVVKRVNPVYPHTKTVHVGRTIGRMHRVDNFFFGNRKLHHTTRVTLTICKPRSMRALARRDPLRQGSSACDSQLLRRGEARKSNFLGGPKQCIGASR